MTRHVCIVIGGWKLENWHLYRRRRHVAAKNAAVSWWDWDRVL